ETLPPFLVEGTLIPANTAHYHENVGQYLESLSNEQVFQCQVSSPLGNSDTIMPGEELVEPCDNCKIRFERTRSSSVSDKETGEPHLDADILSKIDELKD